MVVGSGVVGDIAVVAGSETVVGSGVVVVSRVMGSGVVSSAEVRLGSIHTLKRVGTLITTELKFGKIPISEQFHS